MRGLITRWVFFVAVVVSFVACRSEFEKTRESNDAERIFALANEYYEDGDFFRASTLYELILSQYRGRQEAEQLYYRYADAHFEMQQYLLAAHYFEQFSKTYANSALREKSDYMIALCYTELSPSFRLEQTNTLKAIDAYQRFVNLHPQSDLVPESNDRIDEMRRRLERKAFDSAELYYRMSNYQAALHSFEQVLKDYPETPDAERIRYLIVKSSFDLAANSYIHLQTERYQDVIESFAQFEKRYPSSEYIDELREMVVKSESEIKRLQNV